MSVEDLQNWVKRQNETPKKPNPVMELLRTEYRTYKERSRAINERTDRWAGRFDPTQRKDHVPFSKGVANEFGAMIGRLLGRVLFILLIIWIAYSFGLFNK
jgi:hypothetical protein